MERMWAGDFVGKAGDVSRVVVAMAGLVVAICEDGEMAFGMGCRQLRLCASFVQCLTAGVQTEIQAFLGATETFCARMTLTGRVGGGGVAFVLGLLLPVATVALGVVGLGLARAATMLALFYWTPLGVDVVKFTFAMVATAHSMAFDT